jgi:hypothetical protein
MPLPVSGPLSISQIRNEQVDVWGFPSTYSLRQLSANAGFSSPDAISEFYGYSAIPIITSGLNIYVDASSPKSYPGTGTTWFDLSGNGYNATFAGAVAYNSTGPKFMALTGNTGFISFPNSAGAKGADDSAFSFGGWFNVQETRTGYTMFERGQDLGQFQQNGWSLFIGKSTPSTSQWMSVGVGVDPVTLAITQPLARGGTFPSNNVWLYMVGTWLPGTSSRMRVYGNGNLIATSTPTNTPVLRASTAGWCTANFDFRANQQIALLHVYNRELTAAEVLQNYNATKARFGL